MKTAFEWIPADYWEESLHAGNLEKIYYKTDDFFQKGEQVEKQAWLYRPYSFKSGNSYPVIYFMHGAGTDLDEWVYPAGRPFALCNVLDRMIDKGDILPAIFVFPTYYQGEYKPENADKETDISLAETFPKELRNDLIPAVEEFCIGQTVQNTSLNCRGTRKQRIFGGFSMGGVITWNVFTDCLDLFSVFCPFSGDCWKAGWMGGNRKSEDTGNLLAQEVQKRGYGSDDFLIFAMTGEHDVAVKGMSMQIEKMRTHEPVFCDNNLIFQVMERGEHNYDFGYIYFYHTLKHLHQKELL